MLVRGEEGPSRSLEACARAQKMAPDMAARHTGERKQEPAPGLSRLQITNGEQ